MKHYILDENKKPRAVSLMEWGKFFEEIDNRRVDDTYIWEEVTRHAGCQEGKQGRTKQSEENAKYRVSTVFIGLDGQLFETMVFEIRAGYLAESVDAVRTKSWAAAEKAHRKAVQKWERRANGGERKLES